MVEKIDIGEALKLKDVVFIDVRSPKEYKEDHVLNAINMPILTDEEREETGYIYKQVSHEQAKEMGLSYASYKLVDMYKEIRKIVVEGKKPVFYCFRGGMRSNSVANVMSTMGMKVYLINGGYKSYRKHVINYFEEFSDKHKFIVVHGHTGVGKTKILKQLEKENQNVIDLEAFAKNMGSAFGGIAYNEEIVNQKRFESLIFEKLMSFDEREIFVESESKRIGRVLVPENMFDRMENGRHVLVETTMKNRVNNIMEDYIDEEDHQRNEKLCRAVGFIKKKLGNEKYNQIIDYINTKRYEEAVEELMINYYDPLYQYSIDKIDSYDKIVMYEKEEEAIKQLLNL